VVSHSSAHNLQTVLPHTIIDLPLNHFTPHPNPFIPVTLEAPLAVSVVISAPDEQKAIVGKLSASSSRTLSLPVVRHLDAVPRLFDICIDMLISPGHSLGLPPFLEAYEWYQEKGESHPLLDAKALHTSIPSIPTDDLERVLQALRSGSSAHARLRSDLRRDSMASILGSSGLHDRTDIILQSRRSCSDDASANPYFCPCPSPRHLVFDSSVDALHFRPSRRLFLHPAEERIEWRDLFGHAQLPVQWQGCSPGCLSFLEDEEDWTIDENFA